ncbi:MAG: UTP--glucose-1-phosphate uridylyltransferase, partial [SAR324 cluster bacterium]|nr:UTP--glucose-1-phosphate uridylyltransferase [SAR324 cluster bacterium]
MKSALVEIICSQDPVKRNKSLEAVAYGLDLKTLMLECKELDAFRRISNNLYERVRALFFLSALHRYVIPQKLECLGSGFIPFEGYKHLLNRRFEEAIDDFLNQLDKSGPSDPISSALAAAYKELGFATLANQVRRSVRSVKGNQWMFRVGHGADHPLRIRPELLKRSSEDGLFPILVEKTPVRMDLSHSGWSDIFFLGMDFPEGARVLNVSIDLAVKGRDKEPRPPIEAYLRVIDRPVLRLVSVDLACEAEIRSLSDIFDFARDYLGLLKAAVIAAGIIPPGLEGSGQEMADVLGTIVGPGLGLEIISNVNNIPKGSRLAVSTNLLASLISVCMRATGQAKSLTGTLAESERRLVAARAILGEWLGGSGGGWQDSGGVWPGMKLITGAVASEGDPEFGSSRGRLLPNHKILGEEDCAQCTRQDLQNSLVLVHGGMAQNVGPILEMVTEKYLLRLENEWKGRQQAICILDRILEALKEGNISNVGTYTTENFFGPLQTIIPWASNYYTEALIYQTKQKFSDKFWGFWMLGGMSGGGMGFIFDPTKKNEGQDFLQELMLEMRKKLQYALPFAMDPVVYDFSINSRGTWAELLVDEKAVLPEGYYANVVPYLIKMDPQSLSPMRRAELNRFGALCRTNPELRGMVQLLFDRLFPRVKDKSSGEKTLGELLNQNGFDAEQHERIRSDLRNGRIGLAQNRLPASTVIEDVRVEDVTLCWKETSKETKALGERSLAKGEVGVVSLAAGLGSRWTQGAGVVKALNPFARLGLRHRSFIEVHLAKSRKVGNQVGIYPIHVITTSYLTHDPISDMLSHSNNYDYPGPLFL